MENVCTRQNTYRVWLIVLFDVILNSANAARSVGLIRGIHMDISKRTVLQFLHQTLTSTQHAKQSLASAPIVHPTRLLAAVPSEAAPRSSGPQDSPLRAQHSIEFQKQWIR